MPSLERKWWTLIAVCTAIFMLLLDITVVNVALPDIQRSLHSSFADLQWVVDAYSLTLAAFLLTAGVIGDIYGRREVFASGLVIFSLASLVCGLSTDSLMLNLARAVQGVGGAIMFATSLALIAQAFQGKDRGTAFGIYGGVIGGAVAVGPLVGGAITSAIGWRWIFFVNVPIGIVAIFVTLTRIAPSKGMRTRSIDWIGFISFSASLFLLVFALVRGNDEGWSSPTTVGFISASVVLMVIFFLNERRTRDPMLDLSLFRRPAFVGVSIVAFTISSSIFAMFLYLTLYIQDNLGFAPFPAGVRFLPLTVLAFVVAPFAGRLTVRVQSRFLLALGMLLITGGLLLMARTQPDSTWTVLLPGFLLCGFGVGIVNPVLASASISVVEPQRSGMASGANNTFRQSRHRNRHRHPRSRVPEPDREPHHECAPSDRRRPIGDPPGRHPARGRGIGRGGAPGGGEDPAAGSTCGAPARLSQRLFDHVEPPDDHRRHHRLRRRRRRVLPRSAT